MHFDLKTEIVPLTVEDKKKIKKQVTTAGIFFAVFITFAFCIVHFFFVSSLGYFAYLIFAFFLFVGGIILRGLWQSLNSDEKIVEEGYITKKRIAVSSSTNHSTQSRRGKSTTVTHYITLGNSEFSVASEYYNQVKKGDYVRTEKTIKNKEVFRIEVLTPSASDQIEFKNAPPPKTMFSRADDQKIIRRLFFKRLFFRTLLGGAALFFGSLIVSLVVMLALNKFLSEDNIYYPIFFVYFIFLGLFILFNRITFKLFLDMQSGQKVVSTEQIADCYFKEFTGRNSLQKHQSGYYVRTNQFVLTVDSELGKKLRAGDLLTVTHSPKALVVFDIKKA